MDEDERKRLVRFAILSWILLLVIVVGITFWGSYNIRSIRREISQIPASSESKIVETPVVGERGADGVGIQGERGPKGDPGQSILSPTPTPVPFPIKGDQGEKGDKGDKGDTGDAGAQGPAGIAVYIRDNPDTGAKECRFAGDTDWQPILECQ